MDDEKFICDSSVNAVCWIEYKITALDAYILMYNCTHLQTDQHTGACAHTHSLTHTHTESDTHTVSHTHTERERLVHMITIDFVSGGMKINTIKKMYTCL